MGCPETGIPYYRYLLLFSQVYSQDCVCVWVSSDRCSIMAIIQDAPPAPNGQNGATTKIKPLIHEPLKLNGHLDNHKSFKVTPIIGTEFPDANVAEWLKAPNSDDLIRDLAITSRHPDRGPFGRTWLTSKSSLSARRGVFPRPNRPER